MVVHCKTKFYALCILWHGQQEGTQLTAWMSNDRLYIPNDQITEGWLKNS